MNSCESGRRSSILAGGEEYYILSSDKPLLQQTPERLWETPLVLVVATCFCYISKAEVGGVYNTLCHTLNRFLYPYQMTQRPVAHVLAYL